VNSQPVVERVIVARFRHISADLVAWRDGKREENERKIPGKKGRGRKRSSKPSLTNLLRSNGGSKGGKGVGVLAEEKRRGEKDARS